MRKVQEYQSEMVEINSSLLV